MNALPAVSAWLAGPFPAANRDGFAYTAVFRHVELRLRTVEKASVRVVEQPLAVLAFMGFEWRFIEPLSVGDTIHSVSRMNCPWRASQADFFTSESGGKGTPILPLSNVMQRFVWRCQRSFGPAKPSGAVVVNDPYMSPVMREVGAVPW